jgi:hypothetical protein
MRRTPTATRNRFWKLIEGTWLEDVFWYSLVVGLILLTLAMLALAIYGLASSLDGWAETFVRAHPWLSIFIAISLSFAWGLHIGRKK